MDGRPEYTEQLPLNYLKPQQYLMMARQAAALLRWQITSVSEHFITCRTARGSAFGEMVLISVSDNYATFNSGPVDEYYWVDGQNEANAALFKKAIAKVHGQNTAAQRKLVYTQQEKLGALTVSQTYAVTPWLVYLNVIVFLCMTLASISTINPDTQSLLTWGGNFRPAIGAGQWWRLVTYMFLHAGIVHLAMNMFALLYIGTYLEPLLGKFRYGAAYLLTGICAGLLSISIHGYSVGVGASGAIFGLYGIFLAMLTTTHVEKTVRKTMLRSILFFVVFNLIMGLQGNTDNAAHIGGLISGLVIGYAYYPGLAKHQNITKQVGITAIMAAAVVLLYIAVIMTGRNFIAIQ